MGRKCLPGCTCGLHQKVVPSCPPGCTCGKHRGHPTACKPGCTCLRHDHKWGVIRYREKISNAERSAFLFIMDHVEPQNRGYQDECLIYTGSIKDGRGVFNAQLAYRVVYEEIVGPIPEDHHLHHLCEQPDCVLWSHVQPVTAEEHFRIHKPVKGRKKAHHRL